LVKINRGQSKVSWVISSLGRPGERPDPKKPTTLRGVVGVWDCESTELIVGIGAGVLGLASGIVAIDEAVTSAGRSSDESKYAAAADPMGQKIVANQASEARTFAIIFGSASAVAIGTGAYLVITSHGRTPAASTSGYLIPLVGPGLAGAEFRFAW